MISIIIVSYRCWDRLRVCLQSIQAQDLKDLEVIVVDNNSADGKAHGFITEFPATRFILQDTNDGFAQACNRGAMEAKGEWLLFLNPDTILEPDNLSKVLEQAEANPEWKLIGIRQLNEAGKDTHPHGIFLQWWNVWAPVRSIERLFRGAASSKQYLSTAPVTYPDWISGSFVLIRKNDLATLGGWDERFWMYCEDMDLSKRAADKGWLRVMYNETRCMHAHGGSSRIDPQTKAITKTAVMISTIRYLKKHNGRMAFAFAMDMYFLPRILETLISYPFSPLTRAITKRFLRSRID